jgi:hypothetical protein
MAPILHKLWQIRKAQPQERPGCIAAGAGPAVPPYVALRIAILMLPKQSAMAWVSAWYGLRHRVRSKHTVSAIRRVLSVRSYFFSRTLPL